MTLLENLPAQSGVRLQPVVRRRRVGKIELLKGIEAELKKDIQWLNERDPKGESEKMQGAKYAYKCVIKKLQKYHVGWPNCCETNKG